MDRGLGELLFALSQYQTDGLGGDEQRGACKTLDQYACRGQVYVENGAGL